MNISQNNTPPYDKQHSDADISLARATERIAKQAHTALAKKNVASECFGSSRVCCAGWLVI